jgi:hypothetical protein
MRTHLFIVSLVAVLAINSTVIRAQDSKSSAGDNSKSNTTRPDPYAWKSLFDGKSLEGWTRTNFARGGKVHVEPKFRGGDAAIVVDAGGSLSGFNWTGDSVPKTNYEIELESMKIKGEDFMCGLTFPVGESHASLILGGWGGYITGISSLDNQDASENETQKSLMYAKDRWYKVRMRVMPSRLQAWLDDKKIIDVDTTGKKISLRFGEIDMSVPIGISTYQTDSAFRAIRIRALNAKETAEPKAKLP